MGITEITTLEALLIALSGILIVFFMLAMLSVMITAISRVVSASVAGSGANAPSSASAPAAAGAPVSAASPSATTQDTAAAQASQSEPDVPYGGTIKLLGVDEKTAACIMAVVSHETNIPLSQLVFKSIKAVK